MSWTPSPHLQRQYLIALAAGLTWPINIHRTIIDDDGAPLSWGMGMRVLYTLQLAGLVIDGRLAHPDEPGRWPFEYTVTAKGREVLS